ncbi:MAG: two-component system, NarL family, nitrate/nitrite response regulator NarL [Solirubrobacteraceae bacterium]|jgi:two-component system nitrate/nitrite response regulator NarL|nr:two-component system, NarL family, nitrate/nitrite response regulator NarL [Solirubrobacteraceae bacterium]
MATVESASRIRVVAADLQPLFRESIARVVRECPDLELVGEAAGGREVVALLRTLRPDVAVLDPELPDLDGRRILGLVLVDELPTRVIFVSDGVARTAAYDLVEGGAAGCLTKSTDRAELCEAIISVAGGGVFLTGDSQLAIVREIRLRATIDRPILTEREREVLRRLAAGESAPAMGRAMHLSVGTIKTHLGNLYEKLDVSERAAAVAVAMRRGLLE